ncbi:sulfotransferase domain-containing protein [Sphingomonas sp. QA11]|uniref:sulfotransferase domain-containing protein n=1 Tax=Sphingomonas sp. QA11 TaxID=2950605 RepID=UPI00234A2377|nr:sulfotransferase domain-containing protein [Sphingomonas sp. QA11]WCM28758.1 sulfotransferase domain-containing protein [Sphingomonas sp. QA11]
MAPTADIPKTGGRIDWLASYPKSGNTWLRLLLANYFSETDDPHDINAPGVTRGVARSRWLFDNFLGLSSSDLLPHEALALQPQVYHVMARRNAAPVWLKVHDRQQRLEDGSWLFPPAASGVAVYIIRNPLDVAVSNAFHDGHADMERAVAKLCDPAMTIGTRASSQIPQHLGDWSAHVSSWVDQSDIPVLVLRYEDMLADTAGALARVIAFARPETTIVPDRIDQAVRHCQIEALQSAEREHGFREAPRRTTQFFRSGRAGDWLAHLSIAQADRIRSAHLPVMRRFGYAEAD